jgi:hypothetical protein
MSTFAVEKRLPRPTSSCGSGTAPPTKEQAMRIFEGAAAGLVALAAQVLFVGTVLI